MTMQPKDIWYLASPYANVKYPQDTALPYKRFVDVTKLAAQLLDYGIIVYCPILISESARQVVPSIRETMTAADWLRIDEVFMDACKGMIIYTLDGWNTSEGVAHEIEFFKRARKPIYYVTELAHPQQIHTMLYPRAEYF